MQAHVSAAKAGVDALSQNLAIELAPRGMTSNVIAPGPIAGTEGLERLDQLQDDAQASERAKRIPIGRWGTVKDIANATVWLFSSAGDYVNGATIVGMICHLLACDEHRCMNQPSLAIFILKNTSHDSRWRSLACPRNRTRRWISVSRFPPIRLASNRGQSSKDVETLASNPDALLRRHRSLSLAWQW